ncbi:hypothetical protein HDC92_002242 [Pedobacter sp. AK017]|uniref:hypothetical protein n=1 Tax=Pedobacter sp. AK017 TaxID=2723073 RepID=UPI00161FF399|nr:hypothetical protein [Pedobacter sp. AK017]MBB5438566.1 hypothetical protein [Pedobacter sp. AK017]
MEPDKIIKARLSFACDQNWEAMSDQADGKICSACDKKVYDLTDKNVAYFMKIMQDNDNNVCGRFSNDQLIVGPEPVIGHSSFWKKWWTAAMVFVGLVSLMSKANAQQAKMGKVAVKDNANSCQQTDQMSHTLGIVVMPNDPIDQALYNYVNNYAKVPPSAHGRLVVTFNVKKNGVIDHLAANTHLSKAVRAEILRVIKRAPIAKLVQKDQLKHTAISHTLYFTFEKGTIVD